SGDAVAFTSSGCQHVSSTSAGGSPGTYVATITSTTSLDGPTISATDSTPATPVVGPAMLTQTAGPAASISLALNIPGSIPADGSSTAPAIATVTDAHGNPVVSDSVSISSDGGQSIGPVTPYDNGTYTATITSTTVA